MADTRILSRIWLAMEWKKVRGKASCPGIAQKERQTCTWRQQPLGSKRILLEYFHGHARRPDSDCGDSCCRYICSGTDQFHCSGESGFIRDRKSTRLNSS